MVCGPIDLRLPSQTSTPSNTTSAEKPSVDATRVRFRCAACGCPRDPATSPERRRRTACAFPRGDLRRTLGGERGFARAGPPRFIEAKAGEREPQPPFGGPVTESHTKLVSKPFNSRNGGLIFPIEKIAGQTEKYVEPAQSFAKSGRARGAGGSGAWGLRRLISHPRACHTSCRGRLGRRRRRLTHSGRRWGAERRSPMAPSRVTAGESVPCTRR
jgi:hypothetical protein